MVSFTEINQVPFPLLIVTGYWKSSITKACAKELPQILAKNIAHNYNKIWLDIERVATPKLLPRNCLIYLQTTLQTTSTTCYRILEE